MIPRSCYIEASQIFTRFNSPEDLNKNKWGLVTFRDTNFDPEKVERYLDELDKELALRKDKITKCTNPPNALIILVVFFWCYRQISSLKTAG